MNTPGSLLPRPTPPIKVPAELLRLGYVLLSRIGEGATSEVWDARHIATGRVVAIKVSRTDVPEAPAIAARMQTAWNVGRGLRHPHLVEHVDGGTFPDGRAWLAMERLVGHDLQTELDTRGRLEPPRVIHLAQQLGSALLVLHRRGAIHRDIKPENVFLSATGTAADHAKLIDLGVLSVASDDPERAHDDTGRLIMGTPLYLPPELARGARPDARSDLYALGAMLYHLLAGCPPFDHDDPTEVVRQHVELPVPPLEEAAPGLPHAVYHVVDVLLEKSPDRRPPDAQALLSLLADAADDLAGSPYMTKLREAVVPAVPRSFLPADWRHLHSALARCVGLVWLSKPLPARLADALEWTQDARLAVETAGSAHLQRRERADSLARVRIEAQVRLETQRRELGRALEAELENQRQAQAGIEDAIRRLREIDARYAAPIAALAGVGERPLAGFDAARVSSLRMPIRAALAERAECDAHLARARAAEREAAEQLALLLAEEVEIDNAWRELMLRERDEERRCELQADASADSVNTAQRAYENACLQLYAEYVEHATHALTAAT